MAKRRNKIRYSIVYPYPAFRSGVRDRVRLQIENFLLLDNDLDNTDMFKNQGANEEGRSSTLPVRSTSTCNWKLKSGEFRTGAGASTTGEGVAGGLKGTRNGT